ncbi:preprotein translocase subunit SecE [Jeotgalibacillus salarius]|uniref:Protein translocase subunit SecE n=1 Tax=Jeotgalibacillus salarius TaxID=546023 RepID=A0A4Y8LBQ0_9BACL|nr:preprotein translocase subunit SecE [Jeotgalibacillus salarius]TFD98480.1 preprotein translocase subunit SecE [Jeotgalibacillus salarius]
MSKISNFFRNVASEMRKVSWPRRKELTKYTVTVLSTVIFVAVFFFVVDMGIDAIINWIL